MNNLKYQLLTVSHIQTTVDFYQELMEGAGKAKVEYDCDSQILTVAGHPVHLYCFKPGIYQKTRLPVPGGTQINFLISIPLFEFIWNCAFLRINIKFEGSEIQHLSIGHLISTYLRDPDGNLVQISNLIPDLSAPRYGS